MMRFCGCGLIDRVSRHAIRITDLDAEEQISSCAFAVSSIREQKQFWTLRGKKRFHGSTKIKEPFSRL
jgi:hypothetical protein